MDTSVIDLLVELIQTTSVIVVFAYLVSRSKFFLGILDKQFSFKNQIVLILLFGALSIFGTYGGIKLPSGAIANIRDLGPMVAGLAAGPLTGLGAGLIGGVHRYLLGGFVCVPCALSTILAGLLGGFIHMLRKREFATIWQATLFAALMECLHMGLTLLLARPFSEAVSVVKQVIVPMVIANSLGMAVFAFVVRNLIHERNTAAEKELYRRALERTEYEMETARGIQQSFLPESPPKIAGFELGALNKPARQVGGDFYDFIPISEGKMGIVIADVSGKGVPAALFMALSRAIVRANVHETITTSEAIEKANHLIAEEAKFGMFVTLFYAVLDSKRRLLQYVNAGHNPPLMLKHLASDLILLNANGIALGALDDIRLEQKEVGLVADDIVVLYTDGIIEAVNDKGEQFGMDRLEKIISNNTNLPAQQLADQINDEVQRFAQGQQQFDDLTLIVLKVTGADTSAEK